jgi:hypothetical protein
MRPNGVYAVTSSGTATAANALLELNVNAATAVEIIRATLSPNMDNRHRRGVAVSAYVNDVVMSGLPFTLTDEELQGTADVDSATTIRQLDTVGATPLDLYTAIRSDHGWVYSPQPDERPRLVPGGTIVFGIRLPVAPDPDFTFRTTITFAEWD